MIGFRHEGGSLAYIRAHSQTLVFKEKSGEKETDDKRLAQKKAEQDRVGKQMYAGAHPMANHILIKSDRLFSPDTQKGLWGKLCLYK